jgi:GNAT superfamily N-acetyltransferase
MDFMLRKATIADASNIFELVYELAVYENEPESMITQIADFEIAFTSGQIEAFIVEKDGVTAGMCLYFDYFSTWKGRTLYLEDFIVRPQFRRLGIGKLLFESFLDEARNRKCKLVKWQVLDWNELAKSFYLKYRCQISSEWENCIMEL